MIDLAQVMADTPYYLQVTRFNCTKREARQHNHMVDLKLPSPHNLRYTGYCEVHGSTLVTRWFIKDEYHAAALINHLSGNHHNMFSLNKSSIGLHPINVPNASKWATTWLANQRSLTRK